jgi:alpha-beta hydrolase superfamily lysophospholipase
MNRARRVLDTVLGLIQFLPLSVFATYAFRYGAPTSARWIAAFEMAAVVAAIQLVILLPRHQPANRLILGANLYLLVGGAAAVTHQWWVLEAYDVLGESAIFLFMLTVGGVTTWATPSGFVAVDGAPRDEVRLVSLWMLGATLAAVVVAVVFRGDRTWAAVVPVLALALLQRWLRHRLHARVTGEEGSSRPTPTVATVLRRAGAVALVMAAGGLLSRALVGLAAPGSPETPVYDVTDLMRADYSGLPAPRKLLARDGTPLAVRVYDASGDVVVLAIHGSSGRGRYYHPLATFLSGRGHATVYALDLRGHGESGGRRGDVDYVGQLEDDLADVLAAIRRERPAARVVLLGHSAGGGLAVRYAGRADGPGVDGYVLLAPYLGVDAPPTKPGAGGWARADVPAIRALSVKAAVGDTSGQDAIVLRFNQPAASADPLQVLAYSYRMLVSLSPRPDLSRDLSGIRRPLLVLAGSRDESFRTDLYEPTIAPSAGGTFTVLPDVTHLGLVVNRGTAEALAAWLDRLP